MATRYGRQPRHHSLGTGTGNRDGRRRGSSAARRHSSQSMRRRRPNQESCWSRSRASRSFRARLSCASATASRSSSIYGVTDAGSPFPTAGCSGTSVATSPSDTSTPGSDGAASKSAVIGRQWRRAAFATTTGCRVALAVLLVLVAVATAVGAVVARTDGARLRAHAVVRRHRGRRSSHCEARYADSLQDGSSVHDRIPPPTTVRIR